MRPGYTRAPQRRCILRCCRCGCTAMSGRGCSRDLWAYGLTKCSLPGGALRHELSSTSAGRGGTTNAARRFEKRVFGRRPTECWAMRREGRGHCGCRRVPHHDTRSFSELMRGIHAVRSNWSLRAALTRPSLRRRKDMSMSSALALHRRPPRSACAAAFAVALASAAALDALRRRRAPLLHRLPTPTSAAVPARLHRTASPEGLICAQGSRRVVANP